MRTMNIGSRWTFVLLMAVMDLFTLATAVRWMSIATVAAVDHIKQEEACDQLEGLAKRQKQICRRNLEMMESVRIGAIEAIGECQYQFRSRRWNCSTIDPVSVFGKIINTATRETAFVHAISAAGVAHAVTRACSSGRLDRCGCDRSVEGSARSSASTSSSATTTLPPPFDLETTAGGVTSTRPANQGFQWAGCSDNVAYGSAFSKSFVDARETKAKGRDGARTLMNLHNNNAGRKAIEDYIRVQCKCHGVSGSCELKTCWRSMPSFREVGNILRDRFDAAIEVEQRRSGSRRELVARSARIRQPTDSDLVYIGASPDFCEADTRIGSLGTRGRACNRTSDGTDGCELMCCGRGYDTSRRTVVERCHCKFHWCCYVRCQKCRVEIEEHICR